MYRITPAGRQFLQALVAKCGGRAAFSQQVGIGKNQVKPLVDTPDHTISDSTREKLCAFSPQFQAGIHYILPDQGDACEVRLARDRSAVQTLSFHDQANLERLYAAFLLNPEFQAIHPSFDPLTTFHNDLREWGNSSDDLPAEQFFVYRTYREQVIAFLFGERHFRSATSPLELFVIWSLIGPTNAFYAGSPLNLDTAAKKQLPVGERLSATRLATRLIEELRQTRSVDYLVFELGAQEIAQAGSYGRCLLRVYARAEEEVRQHFAFDPILQQCQFFVLDFPFLAPRWDEETQTATLHPHVLVCCPLKPALNKAFRNGAVPQAVVATLLTSLYAMYWDYLDADTPERQATQASTAEAMQQFQQHSAARGGMIPYYSLRDYVALRFRGSGASVTIGGITP